MHCPATDALRSSLFVSLRPLVQTLESCPASGAQWSSAMPPSLGRGRVTTTATTTTTLGEQLHLRNPVTHGQTYTSVDRPVPMRQTCGGTAVDNHLNGATILVSPPRIRGLKCVYDAITPGCKLRPSDRLTVF